MTNTDDKSIECPSCGNMIYYITLENIKCSKCFFNSFFIDEDCEGNVIIDFYKKDVTLHHSSEDYLNKFKIRPEKKNIYFKHQF